MTLYILLFAFILLSTVIIFYAFKSISIRDADWNLILFFAIGALLNPYTTKSFSNLIGIDIVFLKELRGIVAPFSSLALGVFGLAFGFNFDLKFLINAEREKYRLAFISILLQLICVGTVFTFLLWIFFEERLSYQIIAAGIALALSSAFVSPFRIQKTIVSLNSEGSSASLLFESSKLISSFVIILFGVFSGINNAINSERAFLSFSEWIMLGFFAALALGIILYFILGSNSNENGITAKLISFLFVSCGISLSLNYSAFFINFIIGAALINLSAQKDELKIIIKRLFFPSELAVAFAAGFIFMPENIFLSIFGALIFIFIRRNSLIAASKISFNLSTNKEALNPDIGPGFEPFGAVVLIFMIDFIISFNNPYASLISSILAISFIYFELRNQKSVKNILIDSGEIFKGNK